MEKSAVHIGKQYAVRERRSPDEPFQRVKVLAQPRSGRWKVEWIDPNPGLVDYLPSKAFICPWAERVRFLADERRSTELSRICAHQSPGDDHPIGRAVALAVEAGGEPSISVWKGELSGEPDAIERLAARAAITLEVAPFGYRDRHGTLHLPFGEALRLAKAFCAAEPSTVLTRIAVEEREMQVKVKEPGHAYLLPLLEQNRADWAIVRQWAGADQERAALTAEIERLRDLIQRTVWDLRRPGVDSESVAAHLERAVRGK